MLSHPTYSDHEFWCCLVQKQVRRKSCVGLAVPLLRSFDVERLIS